MYNYFNLFCRYGFIGFFSLLRNLIFTRIYYKKSRLIRFPFYIRGKKNICLGCGLTTGVGCRIEAISGYFTSTHLISFGNNVQINDYVHIAAIQNVTIGNNVLVASKVFISDHNHGIYFGQNGSNPDIPPTERVLSSSEVIIEDNVWIGELVSILPGVIIGKGSIIGANSVVNRNIPPYSIAVGIPARVIKKYNFNLKQWRFIKNETID
jgi:lipopolysaccharide O-acetyltransferase